jgi:hypothetical protein
MNEADIKQVRAALAGTAELDEDVLRRVLDVAETARIDAIVECVAHLNERATLLEMKPGSAHAAAALLRGAAALMELAGFDRQPCPYCSALKTHTAACALGRAVQKWRHALRPGKARISS